MTDAELPPAPVGALPPVPERHTGRIVAIVVAAVVGGLVLMAGAAVAAFFLLSGRGPQPEAAMPGDTLGFVKLDLDPSAGQKINLARFLSTNLPKDAGFTIDPESDDPFGDALDSSGLLDGSDVTWAEIDAWAGDRAAVAALPGNGGSPVPIVIVRVDDESAMQDFFAGRGSEVAYGMVREGYAVLAEDSGTVDRVVGSTDWLADNAAYQFDIEKLGTGQVVAGWADLGGLSAVQSALEPDLEVFSVPEVAAQGHIAFGLTAEPSMLELRSVATGLTANGMAVPALSASNGLATLPDGTVAGLSLANPGEWLTEGLRLAREQDQGSVIDDFTESTGLTEDQVVGLLSTTLTAFVLKNPDGLDEQPLIGVRLVETAESSQENWQDALDTVGIPVAVDTVKGTDGTSYVYLRATDQADVVDLVKASSGSLGTSPEFSQVVSGDSAMSMFVDLSTVWDYIRQNDPEMDTYDDITAVGMSMSAESGDPSVVTTTVRVAFDGS